MPDSDTPVGKNVVVGRGKDLDDIDDDLDDEFDDVDEEEALPDTLTVSQLIEEVNGALTGRFGRGVWVTGEIKGYRPAAGKHLYFDLVEERNGQRAVISVAFFLGVQTRLRPKLARANLELADGVKVRIFGSLDMYAPTGRVSLKMNDLDPRFTLGDLEAQRDEVIRRLKATGRFTDNHDTYLSPVPLNVGLVTSINSAAYNDFVQHLDASGIGFRVAELGAAMQGEDCPRTVSAALAYFAGRDDIDVVVLIRGGGSKNDLAWFDSEQIALAIMDCPIPVLTGIGHEIDHHIADDVAYESFKTPTAVAAMLIEHVQEYSENAEAVWDAICARVQAVVELGSGRLDVIAHRIASATRGVVERSDERLRNSTRRLTPLAAGVVAQALTRTGSAHQRLTLAARARLDRVVMQLDAAENHVRLLDPANTLARGWSITRNSRGEAVRSIADTAPGEQLVTVVADGIINSTVTETRPDPSTQEPT